MPLLLPTNLPAEPQEKVKGYLKVLTQQLGAALQSIVLYGSLARGEYVSGRSNINLLLVLTAVSEDTLVSAGRLHQKWAKEQVVVPLMFTFEELHTFFEVFPLEFLDMNDHHILLEGTTPFTGYSINDQRLLIQCEQELRGNLVRLRQRYVEGWGRNEAIQALLPISLTTLIPCLRGLYRLLGFSSRGTTESILQQLPVHLGMAPGALEEVWLFKQGKSTPGQKEWPRLMSRYLTTLSELITRMDALKNQGKLS